MVHWTSLCCQLVATEACMDVWSAQAGGMHPTGMFSCYDLLSKFMSLTYFCNWITNLSPTEYSKLVSVSFVILSGINLFLDGDINSSNSDF